MTWKRLVICLVLMLVLAGILGCGSSDPSASVIAESAIANAVRAPYLAFERRDAAGLCAAFTSKVRRRLAGLNSPGESCQKQFAVAFARTVPGAPTSVKSDVVRVVARQGDTASATLADATRRDVHIHVELKRVAGVWRVATEPVVHVVSECLDMGVPRDKCSNGATIMLFSIGNPTFAVGYPKGSGAGRRSVVSMPPAVERAGGSAVREFEAGMRVIGQSGCLACHRLGGQGNSGPGPDLSHVGSLLTPQEIKHAILDPTAPMPSFSKMPMKKFGSLIDFLAQLK